MGQISPLILALPRSDGYVIESLVNACAHTHHHHPTIDSSTERHLREHPIQPPYFAVERASTGDKERIRVLLSEVPQAKRIVTIQTRAIRTPPLPSALSRAPPQPSFLYKCAQLFQRLLPKSEEAPGPDKADSAEESPSPSEIFVCMLIRRGHKKGRGILS